MRSVDERRAEGPRPPFVFAVIVFAQFCGTSLWFAGNAVVVPLQELYQWSESSIAHITTAVQAGFITGTLCVTLTGLSDRMSPSRLFFLSCLAGAICNSIPLVSPQSYPLIIISRILTGICLGGIYPVGMKIASDWREQGLGDWLGALVGALVVGTAMPHALRSFDMLRNSAAILPLISIIAFLGGFALFTTVPDGPFRKKSARFSLNHLAKVLRVRDFRAAMFGYFGHMWELYAFWAFTPWLIHRYLDSRGLPADNAALFSFGVIAIGGFGCWAGGKISLRTGSMAVARVALSISALCCILSPLMWLLPLPLFLSLIMLWGFAVVPDSPQFSALVALNAPPDTRGTALTFTTCVGFAITIVSIQLLNLSKEFVSPDYLLWFLAPGPIAGLFATFRKVPSNHKR